MLVECDIQNYHESAHDEIDVSGTQGDWANQSSFVPGRHILDGVVVLHETLHELRRQKEGIVLKLDFEKSWLVGVSDGGP